MSATTLPGLPGPVAARRRRRRHDPVDVLVVGGCLVAPLNLLIVRSLTVYDAALGLALLLMLQRRQTFRLPAMRYQTASYVFILAALLSAFRATYAGEAMSQVLQYLFVFFVQVPVVITVVRTRRKAITSVLLLCVGTLGAILHAFITQSEQGSGRILVFYSENPNRLGYPAVYLLPLVVVLWQCTRGKATSTRFLWGVLAMSSLYLSVWALFASASRSSLLGSVAALVVLVVLRPGQGVLRTVARALVLVVVAGGATVGLTAAGQLPTTLEERINRSLGDDSEDQAGLVGDREHLNNAGIRAFVSSPYLGTGLDNFRYVTTNYDLDATPQLPHNLWLQLLVQVGIFGAAALAVYLLFWFWDLARAFRRARCRTDAELLWGLTASMVGILTIFMFAPEMLDRHYWLVIALGLAVAVHAPRHDDPGSAEPRRTP
jgi:O-antigen ligase